jgi:guanine deaminase
LREALNRGVKVGLGTDIAGGYNVDIMGTMRHAAAVSRMRQGRETTGQASTPGNKSADSSNGSEENLAIDWKESLYLATKGGAVALGLKGGLFEAGAPLDAQMSESPK